MYLKVNPSILPLRCARVRTTKQNAQQYLRERPRLNCRIHGSTAAKNEFSYGED